MRSAICFVTLISLGFAGVQTASASIIHDEGIHGDLSGNGLLPNNFILADGTSSIIATSVAGDREYVHVNIPAGKTFTALNHISWVGADQIGFIAIQNGSTFTEPPTGTNVTNLLGYSHFGPAVGSLGQNLLSPAFLPFGAGSQGFTAPLPSGDYTFWIQQTGGAVTYQLDFVVVPEPATVLLLGAERF